MLKSASLILVTTVIAVFPRPSFADIDWRPCDTATASVGKPVIIMFNAGWCTECRKDAAEITATEAFSSTVASYAPVLCDVASTAGMALSEKFKIVSYPTILFLDIKGAEAGRTPYEGATKNILLIKEGKKPLSLAISEAETKKDDAASNFRAGALSAADNDTSNAKKYLGNVLTTDQSNKLGLSSKAVLILGAEVFMRSQKDYENAANQLEQLEKWTPDSPEAKNVNVMLATAYLKAKREGQAMRLLRMAIRKNPNEYRPYNEFAIFSLINQYRLEEGLSMADKATGLNPSDAESWFVLSKLQLTLGKKTESLKSAETASRLSPTDPCFKNNFNSLNAEAKKEPVPAAPSAPAK